jgi:hypothetical protein
LDGVARDARHAAAAGAARPPCASAIFGSHCPVSRNGSGRALGRMAEVPATSGRPWLGGAPRSQTHVKQCKSVTTDPGAQKQTAGDP